METIELDIDEAVELTFGLKIEGSASGTVSARLCCEGEDGILHAFPGQFAESGAVTFKVHKASKLMTEGVHPAWVEVVVDSKQFVPAEFQIQFKKSVTVQVESVQRSTPAKTAPVVTATLSTPKITKAPSVPSVPVAKAPVVEAAAAPAGPISPSKRFGTLREKFASDKK